MTRLVSGCLLVSLCCAGCVSGPRNPNCEWSDEPAALLDLNKAAHQRHLNEDARVAEELAIRHADSTRGHRSGHFTSVDDYRRTRDRCLAALSRDIASRHGMVPAQVVDAIGRRDGRLDAVVILLFTTLYAFAANGLARRVLVRFPPDEPWPALISTVVAAASVSAAGVMIGGLGSSIVDMIQAGNTHLSYRAGRGPWGEHWLLLFLGAVVVFCSIAVIRWRRHVRFGFS